MEKIVIRKTNRCDTRTLAPGAVVTEEAAKKPTVIIEEYVNVDETFKNIKNIKVGSMTLNDLFGDNLKVIEKALEERKELLKWKDSQQDLIKGKDEYIAKLCNDRAELKDLCKEYQNKNISLIDENTQLIGKNNSLDFENKSLKKELNDLREFAKLFIAEMVDVDCAKECNTYDEYVSCYGRELKEAQFDLVKKVVEKYGKKDKRFDCR